jgi:hypothetical protein
MTMTMLNCLNFGILSEHQNVKTSTMISALIHFCALLSTAHCLANPNVVAYFDFDPKYVKPNGQILDLTGNGHDATLHGGARHSPLTRLNPYPNLEFADSNASLVIPNLPFYGFGTFFAVWMKITQDTVSSVGGKARTMAKAGGLEARCLQSLSSFYVDINREWNALVPLGQSMWFFTIIGFDSAGLYVTIVQSDVVHVQFREQRVDYSQEPHTGFVFGSDWAPVGLIDNLVILRSNIADEQMSHEFATQLGSVAYRYTVPVSVSGAGINAPLARVLSDIAVNREAIDRAALASSSSSTSTSAETSKIISIVTASVIAVCAVLAIGVWILHTRRERANF